MSRKEREDYELEYWEKNGIRLGFDYFENLHKDRLKLFNSLYRLPTNLSIALELGPGPFGGMAVSYNAGEWYLLDPLDETYISMVGVQDNHTHLQAYCEDMPLDDAFVDIVFSCNSLDHADNYPICIDEMFRVLKNGGLICLLVDCRTEAQLNVGHRHAFTPVEIEQKFTSLGFKTLAKKEVKRENKPYLNLAIVIEKVGS